MLVACTLFWGLSFTSMKALELTQQQLLPGADSWFFTALCVTARFAIAALLLLPFAWNQIRTLRRREVEQALLMAAFGGSGLLFQMDGLAYTSASTSAFLTQGYCVFIPIWVACSNRSAPSPRTVLSILLVMTGGGILAGIRGNEFKLGRGELETLVASFCFSGQILSLEHPRFTANRPLGLTVLMLFATSLLALPLTLLTAPSASACWQAYSVPATGAFLAILVLFCTLTAFLLMNIWQRQISATEAGVIYTMEPVFASLMALFLPAVFSQWAGIHYLNETLTSRLLLGGGLITAANLVVHLPGRKSPTLKPPA
jgi:hypothetical protein